MTAAAVELPFDVRAAWRRARLPVVLGVLFLGVGLIIAVVQNAPPERPLHPDDASPVGARALAQLVRDRGVGVHALADPAAATAGSQTTVLVSDPASMTQAELQRLAASTADLVVIEPSQRELTALGSRIRAAGGTGDRVIAPRCGFAPASVAGTVRFTGILYRAPTGTAGCYLDHGASGLVVEQRSGGRTVVFGSPTTFVNRDLSDEGDAALALGLLTDRPVLEWLLPRPPTQAPADAQHKSLVDLLPDRLLWLVLQLFVVVVVVGVWRGRRLGPVVVEPLPVVVRAVETVEGRARLLRAARARGTAATALRTATLARLRELVGGGADTSRPAVVASVARRVGRPDAEVDALLYGVDPVDDAGLVRLANDLDALERSVRRS